MKIDPSNTVRLRAAPGRNMTLKFRVTLTEGGRISGRNGVLYALPKFQQIYRSQWLQWYQTKKYFNNALM